MTSRSITVKPHERVKGVFWTIGPGGERRLATVSQAPGNNVYGETSYKIKGDEYRVWDPYRSKLAAAILKGLSAVPVGPKSRVLYLGAASGTTVSHVSDVVGTEGRVYCVEFAQRSFRELVNNVCAHWINTTPILEDARFPSRYRSIVPEVDSVYCDIAQPDQTRIMTENLDTYLRKSGGFLLTVKARSIDVTKEPRDVFAEETRMLENRGYSIEQTVMLEPFEMDHCMILGRK